MKSNFSVDIEKSRHLPILTKDYLQGDKLNSFYNRSFKLENFKDQIIEKSNFKVEKRKILVQVLKDQNKDYKNTKSYNNIDLLLKKNSFTVTTGHQLSLFSGPFPIKTRSKLVNFDNLNALSKSKTPLCF